jgi:anti-sigma B factor antagonist
MTFTVAIDGRITVNTSDEMRRKLLAALRSSPGQITVDLSRATYMDSSGVATLLEATHIARSQSTSIVLAGVSGQPRSLLAVANLDRLFEFAPQEKDE